MLAFVISLPLLAPAQEQPKPLFFQAEVMTTEGDAWVAGKHFSNWYTGVPLEAMLDGSKGGPGQAVQELNISERAKLASLLPENWFENSSELTEIQKKALDSLLQ